jgi:hypothetical protein
VSCQGSKSIIRGIQDEGIKKTCVFSLRWTLLRKMSAFEDQNLQKGQLKAKASVECYEISCIKATRQWRKWGFYNIVVPLNSAFRLLHHTRYIFRCLPFYGPHCVSPPNRELGLLMSSRRHAFDRSNHQHVSIDYFPW